MWFPNAIYQQPAVNADVVRIHIHAKVNRVNKENPTGLQEFIYESVCGHAHGQFFNRFSEPGRGEESSNCGKKTKEKCANSLHHLYLSGRPRPYGAHVFIG